MDLLNEFHNHYEILLSNIIAKLIKANSRVLQVEYLKKSYEPLIR